MLEKCRVWLAVERVENWQIDAEEGFRQFGLPERKARRAGEVKVGDKILTYVSSRISSFADVRQVTHDGFVRLGRHGTYDTAYEIALRTAPVLVLPQDKWLPLRDVVGRVTFLNASADWRQSMRDSFRRLEKADSDLLLKELKSRADAA